MSQADTRAARSLRAALAVVVTVAVSIAAAVHSMPSAAASTTLRGDPARGKTLYQACAACHSIDENDVGPKHRGVVGRRAGSVADYAYSPALKKSDLAWDEAMLDRWLTNPSALVPGTKMFFKLDDPQARADVIAYLKEQK